MRKPDIRRGFKTRLGVGSHPLLREVQNLRRFNVKVVNEAEQLVPSIRPVLYKAQLGSVLVQDDAPGTASGASLKKCGDLPLQGGHHLPWSAYGRGQRQEHSQALWRLGADK